MLNHAATPHHGPNTITPEIRQALECCLHLPSPPGIALKILELGRDPDVNLATLAQWIAKDPALASRVLRASHSSLFTHRCHSSTNLQQAMVVLGLRATITLALSFSLSHDFQEKTASSKNLALVWRRALISASAARLLGLHIGFPDPETLFLAALLQDIGILALHAAVPERYAPILEGLVDHDTLLAQERQILGTDHGVAGAWLMRRWALPESLAMVAEAVHIPAPTAAPIQSATPSRDTPLLVHCVAIAGTVADLFLTQDQHGHLAEDLACDAGERLGLSCQDLNALMQQIAELLPDIAAIYATEVISGAMVSETLEQAHTILSTLNDQLIHEARARKRYLQDMEMAAARHLDLDLPTDSSKVHQRQRFAEMLEQSWTEATHHHWPLTLAFIDIDQLASINQQRGRGAGDAVLQRVLQELIAQTGDHAAITRYGEDEFLVLLPRTSHAAGTALFERLRQTLATEALATEAVLAASPYTVSVGLASHGDQDHYYPHAQALLRAAGYALYAAKSRP